MKDFSPSSHKINNHNSILPGSKNNLLELSYVNLSDEEQDDGISDKSGLNGNKKKIEDFEAFKK